MRATHNAGRTLMPMPYTYSAAYDMQAKMFAELVTRSLLESEPDQNSISKATRIRGGDSSTAQLETPRREGGARLEGLPLLGRRTGRPIQRMGPARARAQHAAGQLHYAGQQRNIRVSSGAC